MGLGWGWHLVVLEIWGVDISSDMGSAILLERFRGIEKEMEVGAFALVDKEDALAKARRNPSVGLMSLVERKERTKVAADINHEAY
jgi:hypothetical protein